MKTLKVGTRFLASTEHRVPITLSIGMQIALSIIVQFLPSLEVQRGDA